MTDSAEFGGLFSGIAKFVSNAAKTAGRAVGSATKAVSKATGDIGKAIGKVPLVGPLLHAALGVATGPFNIAADIASGKRIDRVAMGALKREVANIKEAAPYAQMVISVVPGIGPIASGAIGTGLALANGQPIGKALLEGAKSALPGGPLAKAAFDAGQAALEGKKVGEIGLSAVGGLTRAVGVPVPKEVANVLASGISVAQSVASGKPIDKALIGEVVRKLPNKQAQEILKELSTGKNPADVLISSSTKLIPGLNPTALKNLKTGLGVGMAMGQAQKLQGVVKRAVGDPKVFNKFANGGLAIAKRDKVTANARKIIGKSGLRGFDAAVGVMHHQAGPQQILAVRDTLSPDEKKGYDMGLSLHIGQTTMIPPKKLGPAGDAGYFMTRGMMGAPEDMKSSIMKTISSDPEAREGAKDAIIEVAHARQSWFDAILEFIGLAPKLPPEKAKA